MEQVCAWCGNTTGTIEGIHEVSHGICPTCAEFYTNDEEAMVDFLNKLKYPVMVVNDEGRVQAANDQVLEIVGKTNDEIKNQLGGDVMSCEHASKPGGCGKTEHCTGCGIRNTVMATFEDHNSRNEVAYMLIQQPDNTIKKLRFNITTEMVNDIVLLQVNEITG